MKHQFNRTLHILTPILVGKFSKFTPPPYFEAPDVSACYTRFWLQESVAQFLLIYLYDRHVEISLSVTYSVAFLGS